MPSLITEVHELPGVEAVLAGTLALMTGYGQALQAELDPGRRLGIGRKVVENLALLGAHPQLSVAFRDVLTGLHRRWRAMTQCTEEAARESSPRGGLTPIGSVLMVAAPKRLQ